MEKQVNIDTLKKGDRLLTVDGALVEVVAETEDGRWIRIRYIADPENPSITGTDDLCAASELAARAN
jgi:hypothetical protein